jgi:hypothetical protein
MRIVIQVNPSQPFQHHMKLLWNFDDTKNQHKWKKNSCYNFVKLRKVCSQRF